MLPGGAVVVHVTDCHTPVRGHVELEESCHPVFLVIGRIQVLEFQPDGHLACNLAGIVHYENVGGICGPLDSVGRAPLLYGDEHGSLPPLVPLPLHIGVDVSPQASV